MSKKVSDRIIVLHCFHVTKCTASQASFMLWCKTIDINIYIRIYYNIYICSPPPQDLLVASFCLPKVLPESFLHNLKEKQKKTKKNKKQPKKKKLRDMSQPEFPQSLFCFFLFFLIFTVASGTFLKKTLSITGLSYSLFP